MRHRIAHLIHRFWIRRLARAKPEHLRSLIVELVENKTKRLPSDKALRFLFELQDAVFFRLEQVAIAHENGIHPKHRLTRYHDFFVARVRPEDRVLDLGCGRGDVAKDVAERTGAEVVAIDVCAPNIKVARERYAHPRVRFEVGDILKELPSGPFDVVILSNVLEHLPGRAAFLRRVCRTVSPQRILLRVPLFERGWEVPLKKELGLDWRMDSTHEVEYTQESFNCEMASAGLVVRHREMRWGEIWAETLPSGA